MPLKTVQALGRFSSVRLRARVRVVLCAAAALKGVLFLPLVSPLILSLAFVPQAMAQQELSAATRALFSAVERNDLPGVQDAIAKGADLQAKDISGTQAVDVAIDQGFFEIAHYLISVRNALQAQEKGGAVQATPSVKELADQAQHPAPPTAAPSPRVSPGVAVSPPPLPPMQGPDPFEVVQPTESLPIIGDVQEPTGGEQPVPQIDPSLSEAPLEPTPEATPEQGSVRVFTLDNPEPKSLKPSPTTLSKLAEQTKSAPLSASKTLTPKNADQGDSTASDPETQSPPVPKKPSAAWTFVATFGNFFKPANITGVTKEEKEEQVESESLSEEELSKQLKQIEDELGNAVIRGPEVPISPDELAKELPISELSPEEIAALPEGESTLPPYSVNPPVFSAPSKASSDPFGSLEIEDAPDASDKTPMPSGPAVRKDTKAKTSKQTAAKPGFKSAPGVPTKPFDASKPFGGGVDPDVLAYLKLDERTGASIGEQAPGEEPQDTATDVPADAPAEDPFAQADPFSAPEKKPAKTPSKAPTQSVAKAAPAAEDDPFSAPSPAAPGKDVDPFSAPPPAPSAAEDDPFASLDNSKAPAVSDLLENLNKPAPTDQNSDDPFAVAAPQKDAGADDNPFGGLLEAPKEKEAGTEGWDVKKVEGADIPKEVVVLADIKPTGAILDGVELIIGENTKIGQEVGEKRMNMLDQVTIHKPCVAKSNRETIFCIDTVNWPLELSGEFEVDTIMYQGTRAIGRYDAGRATKFHTLFRTDAFEKVISYYIARYGQPSETLIRAIAPLAAPRQDNPTYLWQSREPGTDTLITLEIRKFDDALGGGFPDTERGVILLSRNNAKPIFPELSQLELMVLKADVDEPPAPTADAPASPGDIWN